LQFADGDTRNTCLGYFTTIQSFQHTMAPRTVDEPIQCVEDAYWQQPVETTENIFLTLQKCMESTMVARGGNQYKLPHIGKGKIRKNSPEMPKVLECSEEAVYTAIEELCPEV
jgi:hypothetical protein